LAATRFSEFIRSWSFHGLFAPFAILIHAIAPFVHAWQTADSRSDLSINSVRQGGSAASRNLKRQTMTFFDSTPAGALVNALDAAAESDRKALRRQTTTPSKSGARRVTLEGLVDQFRKLIASMERKEAKTS
jgi:hypothetical protein